MDAGQAVPPDDALVGVRLSPADAVLSPGDRLQLSVLLDWASGRSTEATSVAEFASADPSIVAVASGGLAIAVQPGRTTVSATAYGYTIAADLTVTEATARALSVSPASLALEVGGSTLLSAVAAMSDGTSRDVSTLVQYSFSDPSRVRVGADGRVTAVGAGDSVIRAEYQTVRTEVSVRVRESAPTSLSATPAALSLQVGQSAPLSIRARYASGEERDVTRESAFSVDNSAIATVSSDGVVRAIAAGQATVTVVSGGALVEATVTVLAPHVVSLAVSPANASVVKAEELPFVATATYSNGQVATVTGSASWSVDDTSVGTISAAGVFTAIKVGATTVRATLGAQSGFTSVSVTAPTVVLLSLSPNPVTVSPGNTAPIVATARMSNGTSQDVTSQCAWTSSDSAVAVGGASVVLGVTVGTSILTCTAQGRSATTTVVVVASDPALSVSPASVDFGTVYRLTAKVATFTATNGGPNAVTLGTISNAGLGLSENFTYAGGTCTTGKVLLAGESCTIGVAAAALVDGTSQKSLTIPYNYAAKSPATASLSMVVPALALSVGPFAYHTCMTGENGLKCWGYNAAGQLGVGDTSARGDHGTRLVSGLPVLDLGTSETVSVVAVGYQHTCALFSDGTVKCWGYNASGQLGVGDTSARGDGANEMGAALSSVDLGGPARSVSAGEAHTCALMVTGEVKCWGHNAAGELGQGDTANRGGNPAHLGQNLTPVNLGTGRTARSVSCGGTHTCAWLDNGQVKCWGQNNWGQLGLGDTQSRGDGGGEMGDNLPAVSLGSGRTVLQLAAGLDHTCVVLDGATIKCWGANGSGGLGYGDTTLRGAFAGVGMGDSLPNVNLGTGRTAVAVSPGASSTCALLDNGKVKCWGSGFGGALGYGNNASVGNSFGTMGDNLPYVDLGTNRTALALRSGDLHRCALLDNLSIKCWGYNAEGGLGLGDTNDRGNQANEMGDFLPAVDVGN